MSKRRTRQPRSPAPGAPSNRERRTSRRWIWLAGLTTLAVAVAALATVFLIRPVVRRTPDSNVLLITVDTLRADALGSYGNTRARTPVLDRLAANGVRFTTTRAHSVVTLPSHISLLTGLYPFSHGIRDNAGFRLPPNVDTLATVLKGHGYRTGAFVSAFPLDSRFGLARGFDEYDDRFNDGGGASAFQVPERHGAETIARAIAWLKSSPARSFCWVHVYEPHFPYAAGEPLAAEFKDAPYLGEVTATDAALAPLLDPVMAAGAAPTLVIVTSDHGESLGEHGERTHGLFGYEASLRVPLIVYHSASLAARVVDTPVRLVDVATTVTDFLGLTWPGQVEGRSLLPLASGVRDSLPRDSYFEALSAALNRRWAPLYGLVAGSHKFVDLPIPELYDLDADPAEARNVVDRDRALSDRLRRRLDEMRRPDTGVSGQGENDETRRRLQSLGYAASGRPLLARYTEADDPKRLIGIDEELERVVSLYQAGDLAAALALADETERRRPDMPLVAVQRAFLESERGNLERSAAAARRALDLAPDAPDIVALAAGYLTEAGAAADVVSRLEPLATATDADFDVVNAYGVALAAIGRDDAALSAFRRARTIDPSSALPHANEGALQLARGHLEQAEPEFRAAIALDPSSARAWNGLGVVAAQRGDSTGARDAWTRAVALDPRDYQTLFNLGRLLLDGRQPQDARPYFERYLQVAPAALEARDMARVREWLAATAPDRTRQGS